ncbi:Uncharacterized protein yraP [Candidatus Moranella endobia PCVAL]|uniref:BON domain-containing protein n=1 Tax=Moranella endobia (strain PCIT) TaxID=903503 RepID=F7XXU6_MOREP|nr:division/outer membrane stress-associated lipid-binding lipoprotein [Candidatus Moranella endobia]AEI74922.1 conserved hypothetical protein [Candidatus Moranella endobia PCIT]AGJ61169.1 Uncharacterized protein yraP [Candidatus Moranella endobia PCVAL]
MKAYTSLILQLAVLMLQGCVGAMVIGTAVVTTKTVTDPRTFGTQIDDGILEARVANALAKDQKVHKEARISNTVYQGKVLLTGQAPTSKLAEIAKQITMRVDGVTEVYNEIRQGQPVSLKCVLTDTWITTKIRAKLLIRTVNVSKLKITTENGEVFLLGLVTNADGKASSAIASKVNGVKHVTAAFNYL